jgi:sec-independent protein translocase protein TatB
MEILNVGPLEFILIMVIAMVVLGPERMVKGAYAAGRWVYKFVRSPTWAAILSTSREIRELPTKIVRESGIQETMAELQSTVKDVNDEVKQAVQDVNDEVKLAAQDVNSSVSAAVQDVNTQVNQAAHENIVPFVEAKSEGTQVIQEVNQITSEPADEIQQVSIDTGLAEAETTGVEQTPQVNGEIIAEVAFAGGVAGDDTSTLVSDSELVGSLAGEETSQEVFDAVPVLDCEPAEDGLIETVAAPEPSLDPELIEVDDLELAELQEVDSLDADDLKLDPLAEYFTADDKILNSPAETTQSQGEISQETLENPIPDTDSEHTIAPPRPPAEGARA